jgi:hypothetical protein
MKTGIVTSPSIASEELEKSVMGMSAKGMDIASYFLRDKIYSNKALACVREYICNAVDEHIKHNITTPVFVQLKKQDDEVVWSVRDYAKGLDEHGVRNIFGMYFESTKTNTNSMIGGFGIGSKAAHCYTDTFYIKSNHNGVCTLYACVLGGGSKGVPVGEIYKISETPTSESGIEISFNVKGHDTYTFAEVTEKFIKSFGKPNMIKFSKYGGEAITPLHPKDVRQVDGITYNLYDTDSRIINDNVAIRMGGVIYKTFSFDNISGPIIVDVPIGKLTIPISREYLETTTANNIIVSNITAAIRKMYEDDKASVPDIKMGEYLVKQIARSYRKIVAGWFEYSSYELYPKHSQVVRCFKQHMFGYGATAKFEDNGKLKVYVTHNPKSRSRWLNRLHDHLQHTPIIYIEESVKTSVIDTNTDVDVDCSDIEFIDIRKAGIPPVSRDKPDPNRVIRYSIYRNGSRIGNYTAQELEDAACKEMKLPIKDWIKNVNDIKSLNQRTLSYKNTPGWHGTVCQSKVVYKALLDLGWIAVNSQEYLDKKRAIDAAEQERLQLFKASYDVRKYFKTTINERAVRRLCKNPKSIHRFIAVYNAILKENTFRSRMFKMLNDTHTSNLDRSDFRKLLKLTDK